jgi:hypothetical protein
MHFLHYTGYRPTAIPSGLLKSADRSRPLQAVRQGEGQQPFFPFQEVKLGQSEMQREPKVREESSPEVKRSDYEFRLGARSREQ